MITLYDFPLSGHSHRVRFFLSLVQIGHRVELVDLLHGAQRAPDFLALNPFGTVPVIVDDGLVVRDSLAILIYLAQRYAAAAWLPRDPAAAAPVHEWLATAAGDIANGLGAARTSKLFPGASLASYDGAVVRGTRALTVMEAHLADRKWLAAEHPTIAEPACYSYVKAAPEGEISLAPYPNVRAWLALVESLPGFVPFGAAKKAGS